MRTAALVFAALAIAATTASAQGNGEAGARYYQHWAQDGTLVIWPCRMGAPFGNTA